MRDSGGIGLGQLVRIGVVGLVIASTAVAVNGVINADSHDDLPSPPAVIAPDRVYSLPNTPILFNAPDPVVSNPVEQQIIAIVETFDDPPAQECTTATDGPAADLSRCASASLSLSQNVGRLVLAGVTVQDDTFVSGAGAVLNQPAVPDPADPDIFLGDVLRTQTLNIVGTAEQINATLFGLSFVPTTDYEWDGGPRPFLGVTPITRVEDPPGTFSSSTGTQVRIEISVEPVNTGPELDMPGFPLVPVFVDAGETDVALPDPEVTDPDLNKFSPGNNEQMLFAVWTTCGDFRPSSGSYGHRTTLTSALDFAGITDPLAVAAATVAIEAFAPDFPSVFADTGGLTTYRNATLAFATLANVNSVLGGLEYRAPNDDALCLLNVLVTDLGKQGLPFAYLGAGVEIPDYGVDWGVIPIVVGEGAPVTVDVAPAAGQGSPTTGSPVEFTATFSEPVENFMSDDVVVGGTAGATTAVVTGGPAVYTIEVSGMTGPGTVEVSIPADVATGIGPPQNWNQASPPPPASVDWLPPLTVTVEQAAGQADPTSDDTIEFTATFSAAVTDFDETDVVIAGTAMATTATVTGGPTTFTIEVSGMTQTGTVEVSLNAGAATRDAAPGDPSLASTSDDNQVTWNDPLDVPVAVNQAPGQADPTGDSPILFTAVFGEDVSGFASGDVVVGGTAGATTAVVSGGPSTFTIAVSGMTQTGTVTASVPAGVANAVDPPNRPNQASTSTDNVVNWAAPVTVWVEQAIGQDDPADESPVVFTATFSEPVTGLTNGDVVVGGTANATTAAVSGGPTVYTIEVSGMTTNGTVTASLGAGAANAVAAPNNPSMASMSVDNEVTWGMPVTVTVDQAVGQADPTSGDSILFTATFSENVSGLTNGDVVLGGTSAGTSAVVSGGPSVYTITVSGMTNSGTVTASLGAGAANAVAPPNLPSRASTSTDDTVTWNNPLDVPVTVEQAAGQADPTSASPILFTATFDEPVEGLTGGDVLIGGTAGATTAVVTPVSPAVYTIAVSGMVQNGTVTASLPAGAANAIAPPGYPSQASTSTDNTVTWISPPVTVTVEQAAGQADPTSTAPILFTATFSEPVTGFTNGDVVLGGTAGASTAVVSGGPAVYTIAVSGMTNSGSVIASLNAGAANAVAPPNNPSMASTSSDNVVTWNQPATTTTTTTTTTTPTTTTTTTTVPGSPTTTQPGSPTTTQPGSPTTTPAPTTTSPTVPATTLPLPPGVPPTAPVGDGPLGADQTTVVPGAPLTLTGVGFVPGEEVLILLYSSPILLAVTTASSTGAISVTVTIPPGTPAGPHVIAAIGQQHVLTVTINVAGDPADPTAPSFTLPATGGSNPLPAGVWLVLVGLVIVLVSRRPTRTRQPSQAGRSRS